MIRYTRDDDALEIRAEVGARGQAALAVLGFLSEYSRMAQARSAEGRERLRRFLESRRAAQAAMIAAPDEHVHTPRRIIGGAVVCVDCGADMAEGEVSQPDEPKEAGQ